VLTSPTDTVVKSKRWSDTRGIQAANALYLPNTCIQSDEASGSEEWGDFQSKEDKDFKQTAEKEKPKIFWGCEKRCFLNQVSNNA
jgi:hypothetical protein